MTPIEPAPERLRRFADLLEASPRARIPLVEVWRAFGAAFPGRPQGAEERQLLADALDALAQDGTVRLPARRQDVALGVGLPRWVQVATAARPPVSRAWRDHPWRAELSWVPELVRLTDAELAFLQRVQRALVEGGFSEPAPVKYRSLQLTGDEKALERLASGRLFGEGRLSLARLGCLPDVLPLAWARVGPPPRALVFENAGSFAVARDVLAALEEPPYGVVLFGDGYRFQDSIASLLDPPCGPLESIEYLGDLDWPGLAIASAAAARAATLGLPPLRPAAGLHAAMLDGAARLGRPDGWPAEHRAGTARHLDFLPGEVRQPIQRMLESHRRIPEEVLGPRELRALWTGGARAIGEPVEPA